MYNSMTYQGQGWQKPQKSKKYLRGFWGFSEVFGVFLYLKFKNKKSRKNI